MRCKSCGNELRENQAFCTECGTKSDSESSVSNIENQGASEQLVISLKSKIILLASLFVDYLVCCRLIGGWLGLGLLIVAFIATPYIYQSTIKAPIKVIKEFMIHTC